MRIGVVPGDGTGPEVVTEALKVLDTAASRVGLGLEYEHFDIGGERYLRSGVLLPDDVIDSLEKVDAILFGAVGHPEVAPGVLERGIILRLRREFDQYINLRPVKLHPGVAGPLVGKDHNDIDFVVVRENTEGLYVGSGGFAHRGTSHEVATEESVNTRFGVERAIRFAFELAAQTDRNHLTFCGKTNVLVHSHDLWMRVFEEVGAEYGEVDRTYANVDAVCAWMVQSPERFDVIVTDNMFGDIITDLGAAIQGGLGIAAGANLNPDGISMFEPIGGTAPDIAAPGLINPLAAIGAAGLLMTHTGQPELGGMIETAVASVAGSLPSLTAGEMGMTTSEVSNLVSEEIAG